MLMQTQPSPPCRWGRSLSVSWTHLHAPHGDRGGQPGSGLLRLERRKPGEELQREVCLEGLHPLPSPGCPGFRNMECVVSLLVFLRCAHAACLPAVVSSTQFSPCPGPVSALPPVMPLLTPWSLAWKILPTPAFPSPAQPPSPPAPSLFSALLRPTCHVAVLPRTPL